MTDRRRYQTRVLLNSDDDVGDKADQARQTMHSKHFTRQPLRVLPQLPQDIYFSSFYQMLSSRCYGPI
jgi:hypothetical protein